MGAFKGSGQPAVGNKLAAGFRSGRRGQRVHSSSEYPLRWRTSGAWGHEGTSWPGQAARAVAASAVD